MTPARFARGVATLKAIGLPPRPVLEELAPITVPEVVPNGSYIGQTVATAVATNAPTRFVAAAGNPRQTAFRMTTGGALQVGSKLDYEATSSYDLGILAMNAGGISEPESIAVTIADMPDDVDWVPAGTAWAYYEANNASNVTAGDTLTQLTDLTGNGRHFVVDPDSVYPPPILISDVDALDGYPAVDFTQDGTAALLANAAARAAMNGATYFGVQMVVVQTLGSVDRAVVSFSTATNIAASRFRAVRKPGGPTGRLDVNIRRQDAGSMNTSQGNTTLLLVDGSARFVYIGCDFAAGTVTYRVGGTTEVDAVTGWTLGTASATDVLRATIGYDPIGSLSSGYQLAALALYRTEPTTANLDADYLFFQQKYGVA